MKPLRQDVTQLLKWWGSMRPRRRGRESLALASVSAKRRVIACGSVSVTVSSVKNRQRAMDWRLLLFFSLT
ncbi:hypothetical protein J6590_063390, partial [Homalodisca vitripennis]